MVPLHRYQVCRNVRPTRLLVTVEDRRKSVAYYPYSSLTTHVDGDDLSRELPILEEVVGYCVGRFGSRHGYLIAGPLFRYTEPAKFL